MAGKGPAQRLLSALNKPTPETNQTLKYHPMNMRTKTAALAFLAASVSALADVKLNDNFSVGGYAAVGSYQELEGERLAIHR